MVTIRVFGQEKTVAEHTTLFDLAKEMKKEKVYVLAKKSGILCELYKEVEEGDDIVFLTTKDKAGMSAYKRSMTFLMLKAFHDLFKKKDAKVMVKHSLGESYYCEVDGEDKEEALLRLQEVKERMEVLIKEDWPIEKHIIRTEEAMERFHQYGMTAKENLFCYRRGSTTNLYAIDGYEDYFYGYMVPSTGVLSVFSLEPYENGFLLRMPAREQPEEIAPFIHRPKLFQILKEAEEWGNTLEIQTVGALNNAIVDGRMNEVILIQEALQEKRLANLADEIIKNKKKIVLIAGPSSSGKTTFSHRLSIQLKIHGMKPHPISIDNYFKNREDTPKDENGEYNFEVLEALDIDLFQENMRALLSGKKVSMPTFNFISGEKEFRNHWLQLTDKDILVIEGIHGLNGELTKELPKESIFKIYISALTPINIDEHNRVATTDARLLRRIVRDASYRGTKAKDTIARWDSVRRGEENYIFPYQEEADAMFNSALIYEISVLKQYAEPLLYAVPTDCEEYQEAKRLLKFLDYFLGIPSESIPNNSLIREFIGGNCFNI